MSFDDEYSMKYNRRSWRTILLPLMGFIIAACSAGIAYALSFVATPFVRQRIQGLPDDDGIQIVIGLSIFLVLIALFAIMYAIFAPKPTKMISESQLDKEKKERERELRERKKRNRKVRIQMMRENQERENRNR